MKVGMLALGTVLVGGFVAGSLAPAPALAGHLDAVELTPLHARWAEYSLPLRDREEVRGKRPRPPESVMAMVQRTEETERGRLNPDNGEWVIPETLGLRLLRGFHPDGLEVYVLVTESPPTTPKPWFLFLHDRSTGVVSPRPVRLTERWLPEKRPVVHFLDLDGDGLHEIGVHQIQHNGTVENIDREYYFQVGPGLELQEALVLDTDGNDIYSRKEWGTVRRRLWRVDGGQLMVQVWRENARFGVEPVPIGEVRLAQEPDGRWRVRERRSQLTTPEDLDHYKDQLHASSISEIYR